LIISLSPYGNLQLSDGDLYAVEIPATVGGLIYLKSMLLSRQLGAVKLGQSGAPTQAQIDAAVAAFSRQREINPYPSIETKDIDL
jgi:hypothetical protein